MDWGGFFLFNALCDLFSSRDHLYDDDGLSVYTPKPTRRPQSTPQKEEEGFDFILAIAIVSLIILIISFIGILSV